MEIEYTYGKRLPAIVLFAKPGAGKGTYSQVFDREEFYYVSTGEVFTQIAKVDAEIAQIMKTPKLIDDKVVISTFYKFIDEETSKYKLHNTGFNFLKQKMLWDGLPRTLMQAKALEADFDIIGAFGIYAKNDRCIKRMLKRGRSQDDTEEKAYGRLNEYFDKTIHAEEYVKSYLEKDGLFISIDNDEEFLDENGNTDMQKIMENARQKVLPGLEHILRTYKNKR